MVSAPTGQDLRLEEFLEGSLMAEGEFRDPFGRVRRTFTAQLTGTRLPNAIRVEEHFLYNDGETDDREWLIEVLGDGHYRGTANDVVDVAEGRVHGNRLDWRYPIELKINGRPWRLTFADRFELDGTGALINTARVSKFGLPVGSVYQVIRKAPALAAGQAAD